MKNLKPSELPVGTVIYGGPPDQCDGLYIKKEGNFWEDLFSGCGCCKSQERISDEGCEEDEDDLNLYCEPYRLTTTKTSDEYFKNFKILSLPIGVVENMAHEYSITLGIDIRDFAIEESIKRVRNGWKRDA